jgi:hypothetical protein
LSAASISIRASRELVLVSFIFAFFGELPFKDFPDFIYGVRVFWALVIAYAAYTGKPQRHAALVLGAFLNLVIGNFNHYFRKNHNTIALFPHR